LRSVLHKLEELSGHHLEVRTDPALVRAVEVHRLVGGNQRLTDAIGPLRYVDFDATLKWMWEGART
jgi:hypothetical protein